MAAGNVAQGVSAASAAKPNPAVVAGAAKAVTAAEAKAKPAREVTTVKMSDGRSVEFVGKRKLLKETIIDGQKVSVRLDFRNGETRLFPIPASLMPKSAGHGMEQKLGDETAGTEKVEDMVLEVDELIAQLAKGEWTTVREAGGFSGASAVIRAIAEVSTARRAKQGKPACSLDEVKAMLQKKIDDAKTRGENLSRKALYDSFRNPNLEIGKVIERIEREERTGKGAIDADAALAELG